MSILRLHDEIALQTLIANYGKGEVIAALLELKDQKRKQIKQCGKPDCPCDESPHMICGRDPKREIKLS